MTRITKIVYGSVLGVIALLLALGGLYDLSISNTVYQPDNLVAMILEGAGIFPPFVFVGATFAVLFFLVKEEDARYGLKKFLFAAGIVASYLVFGFIGAERLAVLWQRALVGVGTSILLTPLTLLFFKNKTRETLKRFEIFLIFASIVCVISSALAINALKVVWGRVRYREMIADDKAFAAFTPWYHINGFSLSHRSFPSGHTCAATTLLTLLAAEEVFPKAQGRKRELLLVIGLYILIMAYSRLVLGAHFLSDVTAGFAVGAVTYAVARYLYFDKSRVVIDALMKVGGADKVQDYSLPQESAAEGGADEQTQREATDVSFEDGEEQASAQEQVKNDEEA